jgi:hypothetical protein
MLIVAGILATGCGTTHVKREQPFTKEWAYQRERERSVRPPVEELVIVGGEDGARASVKVDKRGKPYLNFWKKRGISADLDVDHDEVEVGLKYEREWGSKNEERRGNRVTR